MPVENRGRGSSDELTEYGCNFSGSSHDDGSPSTLVVVVVVSGSTVEVDDTGVLVVTGADVVMGSTAVDVVDDWTAMVDVDDTCVVVAVIEVVVTGAVLDVVAGTEEAAVELEEGRVEVMEVVEAASATPDISTDFALSLSDVS